MEHVPSAKTVRVELHVRLDASIFCEPTSRAERLWIGERDRVPGDRPMVASRDVQSGMTALRDMKDVPMTSYDSRPGRDALTALTS